jgi:hypothetical protein
MGLAIPLESGIIKTMCRRLAVRNERLITVYLGFLHLACIIITLSQFCNDF